MSEEKKNIEEQIAEEFIGIVSAVHDSMNGIYQAHKEEFEKTFGHPLRFYWRWHGFDLEGFVTSFALQVKFMSIRDVVECRFGKRAADLIKILIG